MKAKKGQRNLAKELWAHRDDPGEWGEEPVRIEVRPSRMELVSFRLPSSELDVLQEAASQSGESLSEFVRAAVSLRLGRSGAVNNVEITTGLRLVTTQGPTTVTARRTWNSTPLRKNLPDELTKTA